MIDRDHELPIKHQAELLNISRGTVYYVPRPDSEADLMTMRKIDELHLQFPFMGARQLSRHLKIDGVDIGRRHTRTLMRRMGLEALCPQPGTSNRHPGHKIYPYLLRHLKIDSANQVWALDTTYVPMAKGFVYLTAVVDVASRRVLAHKVAITLEASHAVEILQEAFARFGKPDIVNTDQGSQFTDQDFVDAVKDQGSQLSMDGKGAWRDNVFVERLWRTVKYERIYLMVYSNAKAARDDIAEYIEWYNQERPHSSVNNITPKQAYCDFLTKTADAA